ncbi:alpha/beta-hydrolase [Eremomyces bilateralis CBS 781.70]|uniref:Alpha/beta-hydrolase n=1 Tax=Eremomyces bilateralis CBS 781.70 TaxID=1392243 RepID=A0A6G1FVF2_9PEZI|nr:alpha/beta-hydrolase [Eremomyces bilateralis CBS 781.70]KAF1809700.1 alpha/beta-hydrolase [Eremomyces bilateralis CBS 781.70]
MITYPFKSKDKKAPRYINDLAYAAVRDAVMSRTLQQARGMTPGSDKVLDRMVKRRRKKLDNVKLPEGILAHWLGPRNAKYTMIYYHGGGFIDAIMPGHVRFLFSLMKEMRKSGKNMSVVVLAYSLAPEKPYPTQLRQGVNFLRHMIEVEKKDTSQLIIAGDSAGGNLVLSVLSHIAHPHPDIPPLNLPGPLHAAVAFSPWISFRGTEDSMIENIGSDIFYPATVVWAAKNFLYSGIGKGRKPRPGHLGDEWSEPIVCDEQWWEGAASLVTHMMIWGGGGEIMIDSIREIAQKITTGFENAAKAAWEGERENIGKVTLIVAPRACHVEPVVDHSMPFKNQKSSQGIREYLRSILD